MSTPAKPNGYLLADTNALVYAYRAGREPLLDRYSKFAKKQGRELAITEAIAKEIEDGPLKEELGRYIADRKIKVLLAPDTEQKLKAGQIPRKNSGELSMVEVAKREHTAGRSPGIWADDKFFRSPQNYRDAPGVQPVKTSELLDQMRSEQSITEPEYRHAQAGYQQTRPEFNPRSTEFSKRLGSFDGPEPRFIDHLGAADARIAAKPGFQTAVKGAGVGGGIAMAYDAYSTTREAAHLLDQGNVTGAQSQVLHFGGRAGGGIVGGFAAGAAYGAATGSWTGPGAIGTGLVGGMVGAIAGDKIMDAADQARIYNQRGSDGHPWHFDDKQGWSRTERIQTLTQDPANPKPGEPLYHYTSRTLQPGARLDDELNYKASSVSVELALARAPALQDPFKQAPEVLGAAVRPGIGGNQPWTRDPQSHVWSRQVTEPATPMTHGMPVQRTVTADPEQTLQLEAAAKAAIAHNIAHGSQAIAQRYQDAYEHRGWKDHGPVPGAVTHAANAPPSELPASDGHTYTQDNKGQWTTAGALYGTNTAPSQVREELNATRQQMRPRLTPQQIEAAVAPRATATPQHEPRAPVTAPTPLPAGRMSFAEAHKRRDEPEQISPGSLQPAGKLDASQMDKGSKLYRAHQAQEQDLVRGLGIALAQDRERFKNEPAPGRQQPSVERTQERAQRPLLEEAPVHKPAVPSVPAAEAPHSLAPSQPLAEPAAAAIAEAQARAAAAQAELAEMRQQIARMTEERRHEGPQRRDERDERDRRETTQVAQSHDARQHPDAAARDRQVFANAAADSSPRPLPAVARGAPGLNDPRNVLNPNHALFTQLKERIPDASEKRLLQFSAACHANRITAESLGTIHFDRHGGNMIFTSSWPPRPLVAVDLKNPSPELSQSIQHIEQIDQQRAQMTSDMRAQNVAQRIQQQRPELAGFLAQ